MAICQVFIYFMYSWPFRSCWFHVFMAISFMVISGEHGHFVHGDFQMGDAVVIWLFSKNESCFVGVHLLYSQARCYSCKILFIIVFVIDWKLFFIKILIVYLMPWRFCLFEYIANWMFLYTIVAVCIQVRELNVGDCGIVLGQKWPAVLRNSRKLTNGKETK